jgi:hypothetical protein
VTVGSFDVWTGVVGAAVPLWEGPVGAGVEAVAPVTRGVDEVVASGEGVVACPQPASSRHSRPLIIAR